MNLEVPFCDLKRQYRRIKTEIDNAIFSVIEETAFVRGKYVSEFEVGFKKKTGAKNCISCGNGTDAIYIVLKSLGVGPGDEVITTSLSWIATSETITQAGAKPVFVDLDPYFCLDVSKIEAKVNSRTKAIIPVHLYGQPAEMDKIMAICKKNNLFLIEDCAQAHFSKYKEKNVGLLGNAGTFSFYPGKNLGAYGDAGVIITDDDTLAAKCRMFANHGSVTKHDHEIEGINSRMDGIQAAVLTVKLQYILEWNEKRLQNALLYNKLLKNIIQIKTPEIRTDCTHIFHLYVIRSEKRNELQKYLQENNISTAIHYPKALPFLKAYGYLNNKEKDFPVAYKYQNEILSLPMFPELSSEEIEYVCEKISSFFK
ncbi:MAG: hypothetical protein ACD_79C00287G0019 [uncultured bacterium]|nr:MAG: hypothetical protein ACD_79C00287G0019 [uncultured bacterium]